MAGKHAKTLAKERFIRNLLAEQQPMSVRAVAYQCFNHKFITSMKKHCVETISNYLRDARIDGTIPWEWISEAGREFESGPVRHQDAVEIPDVAGWIRFAGRDIARNHWEGQPRILLIVEKETIAETVRDAIRNLPVSLAVTKGTSSWTLLKTIVDWMQESDDVPHLFYCGDSDPKGRWMDDTDLPTRLTTLGAVIAPHTIQRIAVTNEQITDLDLENLTFPASDKAADDNYDGFVERYGDRCIELDAVLPNDLRRLIREAITPLVDFARRDAIRKRARQEREAIDASLEELIETLEEDDILTDLAKTHERIIEEDFAKITAGLDPAYPLPDGDEDDDEDDDESWGLGWDADGD